MNEKLPPSGGLPPRHLEQVFTPPAKRSENLQRILSAVPPAKARVVPAQDPAPSVEAEADAAPATIEEVKTEPTESSRPDPVDRAAPLPGGSDARKMIIVYMPASQREWLRKAAVGSTQLYVVLSAVDQVERAGKLAEAIAKAQQPDTSGLFVLPQTTRGGSTNVQVSLWALESHIKVLDDLVSKYAAPSRSALVRAALAYKQHHRH
ncbi:hypothetical protein E0H75_42430 [Kribbella capetownensis]|uniref:Uncharacterized protein n=1 Tax=Kribbella capetownensis TaxID=1572659 RepID=A0A4R0INI8_9ACTN|nr:hypothetical protein [Kribbella capetownensis]TCC33914.1 hypothetical protein E0H75_42430 [Kribbella capetownensis]